MAEPLVTSGKATHESEPRGAQLLELSSNCEWAWTRGTLLQRLEAVSKQFSLPAERVLSQSTIPVRHRSILCWCSAYCGLTEAVPSKNAIMDRYLDRCSSSSGGQQPKPRVPPSSTRRLCGYAERIPAATVVPLGTRWSSVCLSSSRLGGAYLHHGSRLWRPQEQPFCCAVSLRVSVVVGIVFSPLYPTPCCRDDVATNVVQLVALNSGSYVDHDW